MSEFYGLYDSQPHPEDSDRFYLTTKGVDIHLSELATLEDMGEPGVPFADLINERIERAHELIGEDWQRMLISSSPDAYVFFSYDELPLIAEAYRDRARMAERILAAYDTDSSGYDLDDIAYVREMLPIDLLRVTIFAQFSRGTFN